MFEHFKNNLIVKLIENTDIYSNVVFALFEKIPQKNLESMMKGYYSHMESEE